MRIYINCLLVINVIAFLLYGIDKIAAKLNIRRIPEKVLLQCSIFGGVYGAVLGMILFHHKVRKKLFIGVNLSCLIIYSIFSYILWRNL